MIRRIQSSESESRPLRCLFITLGAGSLDIRRTPSPVLRSSGRRVYLVAPPLLYPAPTAGRHHARRRRDVLCCSVGCSAACADSCSTSLAAALAALQRLAAEVACRATAAWQAALQGRAAAALAAQPRRVPLRRLLLQRPSHRCAPATPAAPPLRVSRLTVPAAPQSLALLPLVSEFT